MASEHLAMKADLKMEANLASTTPLSVASLISTLIETLNAANDLQRRMKKKIKSFQSEDEVRITRKERRTSRKRKDSSSSSSSSSDHRKHDWRKKVSRGRSKDKSRKRDSSSSDSDDDSVSITKLAIQVKAEYDLGCERHGERFIAGDFRVHAVLQAQIIVVQQSMLLVYRDSSLFDGFSRYPMTYFLSRLAQSCITAKSLAIDALASLHQHLLHPLHPRRDSCEPETPRIPGAYPVPILPSNPVSRDDKHRTSVVISHTHQTITGKGSSSSSDPNSSSGTNLSSPISRRKSLFCPYALDLQRDTGRPLADSYKLSSGNGCCPFCKFYIHTKPGKAWEVILDDKGSRRDRHRRFLITNRFVVKCHRDGGGFACVLCSRWGNCDTVMKGVEELVDHVWKEHGIGEVRVEEDVLED